MFLAHITAVFTLIKAELEEPGCIMPVSKELSIAVAVYGADSLLTQIILTPLETLAELGRQNILTSSLPGQAH